jgi:hypothetical protein
VYAEYRPQSTDSDYYRSRILDGQVALDEASTGERLSSGHERGLIQAHVIWKRVPYWEGPETSVPLTNAKGADVTTGLEVYNPCPVVEGMDISFVNAAPNYFIRKVSTGLDEFKIGDTIIIVGSDSNDGTYTITDIEVIPHPGENMVVAEAVVNEVAGHNVRMIGPTRNYVDIAAEDLLGDLPAPALLQIENDTDATHMGRVYVAQNILSGPADLIHILEAEDATNGAPGGDDMQGSSSQGYRAIVEWATDVEQLLLTFTIASAQALYCAGNYFRLLMRFDPYQDGVGFWYKVKIEAELITLWESEWVLAVDEESLLELATVRIPPFITTGTPRDVKIKLYGKHPAGGAVTQYIDYLQLSPMDGWRALLAVENFCDHESTVVDNMIDNRLYVEDPAGESWCYYTSSAPIYILPGVDQRFYFLNTNDTFAAAISRRSLIKIIYRPRRSTI